MCYKKTYSFTSDSHYASAGQGQASLVWAVGLLHLVLSYLPDSPTIPLAAPVLGAYLC